MPHSSIRSIAAEAGVGKSTVSLALRGFKSVAPETRTRILEIANRVGYRINPLVAALMTQQRIGHAAEGAPVIARIEIFPDCAPEARINLDDSYRSFQAMAAECGYSPVRFQVYDTLMSPTRLQQILRNRGIRGLVVVHSGESEPPVWQIDWRDFSSVHLGSSERRWNYVRRDLVEGTRCALTRLAQLGYQRIGWASGALLSAGSESIGLVMRDHTASRPARNRVPLLVSDEHWNERDFLAWFRRHRPDAIIGRDLWALHWLRAAGVRMPEDVGYVCINVLTEQKGQCAGIDSDALEQMRQSIHLLDGLLRRNETGPPARPVAVLTPPTWLDGPTVRAQAPSRSTRPVPA